MTTKTYKTITKGQERDTKLPSVTGDKVDEDGESEPKTTFADLRTKTVILLLQTGFIELGDTVLLACHCE